MRCVLMFVDKLPSYSHCTFEDGLCGWNNKEMTWMRQNGSYTNGPRKDHTYQNESGQFLYHLVELLSLCSRAEGSLCIQYSVTHTHM
jgi:hypothetical protein